MKPRRKGDHGGVIGEHGREDRVQGAVAPSVSDEDQHAYYDPSGGVRRDFDAATLGDIGCSVPRRL